jgi:hypothetical protein
VKDLFRKALREVKFYHSLSIYQNLPNKSQPNAYDNRYQVNKLPYLEEAEEKCMAHV